MSDEDRLRERLRERAERVPYLADLDDVAVRLGRRRPVRERRLLALVALAFVVGIGGGVALARGHDSGGHTLAIAGAGGPETTAQPTVGSTAVTNTTLPPCTDQYMFKLNGIPACVPQTVPQPTLPAPGSEQPADAVAARQAVEHAIVSATDGTSSEQTRAAAIQGGAGMMGVFDDLLNGQYGDQVRSARTVVEDVVFTSATAATVRYHANLPDGQVSGPYTGNVVSSGTTWLMTRASYCQVVALAGVRCPQ
jgi:hypothetical protein